MASDEVHEMQENSLARRALGLEETGLVTLPDGRNRIQQALLAPLAQLNAAAVRAGFTLGVASGFRGFAQQAAIWNAKARGERPILDPRERPLDPETLDDEQKLWAILRWSALPGTSRHHWGTDIDVYECSHLPEGYVLQLTRAECAPGGPLADFHHWLSEYLASVDNPGFYRPYSEDTGGVSPEPWHLSFAPLAEPLETVLTETLVERQVASADLALKPQILTHLSAIMRRFVHSSAAGLRTEVGP
ncbi:M15 family metallopeptidase [Marinimicrobium alkaliphilum]|uniref:M15 family metallopeptidase n=1 Tax=Marinimicrobium alkaliphilum TaxID=2202654 RepID=UPI000DB951AB|nr:M15 family metallopeptidase [Marinimicrobium alkaliphilum]